MARRKPFSAARTCEVVCKIILFYSVFYIVMKLIAAFSKNGVLGEFLPNLIISIPFIILALIGFRLTKINSYSWVYVIVGVVSITLIRYFNNSGEIILWLSQNL